MPIKRQIIKGILLLKMPIVLFIEFMTLLFLSLTLLPTKAADLPPYDNAYAN
tara:strand:- start:20283 stop:20438 length:156 start_codon:yes stop_codon:yes gene_type:complete